ncbi:MAG TPA: hypothetical protein VGD62_06460, partial [Acidobacteriaceae bacterium]
MTPSTDRVGLGEAPAVRGRVRMPAGMRSGMPSGRAVPMEVVAACVTLLLCFSPGARLVQYLYTPACAAIAYALMRRSPSRYAAFTLYLWFFSPFVRRVADLHASFLDPSPMLLAPLVASGVSIVWLFRKRAVLTSRAFLPFSLPVLGIGYGFAVGLLESPLRAAVQDLVLWFSPLLFGAYCCA